MTVESVSKETLAAALVREHQQLNDVRHQVLMAAATAPHPLDSGWRGPAARAFQGSLETLSRELSEVGGLLHSAVQTTEAALWELGGHV